MVNSIIKGHIFCGKNVAKIGFFEKNGAKMWQILVQFPNKKKRHFCLYKNASKGH